MNNRLKHLYIIGILVLLLQGLSWVADDTAIDSGATAWMLASTALVLLMILLKDKLGYDDSLDAFGIHGVGGITGALFLTFFIRKSWMADAAAAAGGSWSIWQQFAVQLLAVLIAIGYAAILTLLLILLVQKTVGFRASEENEMAGLDHGEHGYGMLNAS